MKSALISLLGVGGALLGVLMVSSALAAQLNSTAATATTFTDYHYEQRLDIARVLSHTEVPPVCYVVPVEMTYEDSQGNQHTIRYHAMGTGCLSG